MRGTDPTLSRYGTEPSPSAHLTFYDKANTDSEYFSLSAKRFRTLAAMASAAEQKKRETEELWKKIEAIEAREKVVLIKE